MSAERDLWREVLFTAVTDAVEGISAVNGSKAAGLHATQRARDYILRPNRDFNTVCHLAGLDPQAVRDAVRKQLENRQTTEATPSREVAVIPMPGRKPMTYTVFGQTKTLREWAREYGISFKTLQARMYRHSWTFERALTEPVGHFRRR